MEEYEDNVPDENIQIISPKKCNFFLKDMNMFIKSEKKRNNKYNIEDNENKQKSDVSEKLQTTIKESTLLSININKDVNILKESNESNSYQRNKFQNKKITEAPKFPETKLVNINLNNLYKENTNLLKKTKNKISPKINKKKKIKHRNNYIKNVNLEQINLTQRTKMDNAKKLLKENKSNSVNKEFFEAHNIKNIKIKSAKIPKQILFEKKSLKKSLSNQKNKLDLPTNKTSSKNKIISKKATSKEIREIKTQKKLKFIHSNNNNINRTFLKDFTTYKNDSKGKSVNLKKKLNLKLENNKNFLTNKENNKYSIYNNSISVLINYKNLSKIKNSYKSKKFNINHSHNKNKRPTTFIFGFKTIIQILRKKLIEYFFLKLRKFNQNRIISINAEYKIDSPIKNIFKKNIYIYGTNRKLHKYKDKNNCIHQSTKRKKKN